MTHRVGVLIGSARRDSINRQLANALGRMAAPALAFQEIEISDLPMYNDDLWEEVPDAVARLKRDVEAADALLFVTPEYNRSMPALLKNAIDWASRPKGANSWAGKPLSIIGASIGVIGTAAAQAHLKSIMIALDAIVMGQPEVYLAWRPGLIDADGEVTDESARTFLAVYLSRFNAWIERVHG